MPSEAGSLSLCPTCGPAPAKTTDTRLGKMGKRRRKSCLSCGAVFRTVEVIEADLPGLKAVVLTVEALDRIALALVAERRLLSGTLASLSSPDLQKEPDADGCPQPSEPPGASDMA